MFCEVPYKNICMNKSIIIASAVTAGAAALFLLLRKKRAGFNQPKPQAAPHSRHLTDTFAKAKQLEQENDSLAQGI